MTPISLKGFILLGICIAKNPPSLHPVHFNLPRVQNGPCLLCLEAHVALAYITLALCKGK